MSDSCNQRNVTCVCSPKHILDSVGGMRFQKLTRSGTANRITYRLYLFLPPKRKRPTDREFVLEDSIEIRYASISPGRENRVTSEVSICDACLHACSILQFKGLVRPGRIGTYRTFSCRLHCDDRRSSDGEQLTGT